MMESTPLIDFLPSNIIVPSLLSLSLCFLHSHFDVVTSLSFHPSEPLILTGSQDSSLKLWNLHSKKPYVLRSPTASDKLTNPFLSNIWV